MNREELHNLFIRYPPIADEEELWWLIQKLKEIKPFETVIEIGVSGGGTLKIWEQLLPKGGLLIGVDKEISSPSLWDYQKSDRRVMMVYGDSTDPNTVNKVVSLLGGRKADFLYIDACHEYEYVLADYRNYSPFVRNNGVIAFHNTGTRWVNKVFESLKGGKNRVALAHGIGISYVSR